MIFVKFAILLVLILFIIAELIQEYRNMRCKKGLHSPFAFEDGCRCKHCWKAIE